MSRKRDVNWLFVAIAVAAALGIEPKRLRGFMWRNGIADPIGDQDRVYGWSCRALAAKLATASRESAGDN